jgi:sarcosine oxidase subunit alpha
MHDKHVALGATFLDAGRWKRPHSYVDSQLEARRVRDGLGLIDVSTLGKLSIAGSDSLDLLHLLLPGLYRKLACGRTRYITMLGEDGVLSDDGTLSHLPDGSYYWTTTTGNQDAIAARISWWITTERFDVRLTNLSAVNGAVNVSGLSSRALMETLAKDIDFAADAFPYMACRGGTIQGVKVMVFRIGFTGDLSYEIHFASEYGEAMWDLLMREGQPHGLVPFGVETQRILRLEKSHLLVGTDSDALSNPFDAGVGFTVQRTTKDFVGRALLARGADSDGPSPKLVPFELAAGDPIPEDGVAVFAGGEPIGRVTSARLSPALGRGMGLLWAERRHAEPGSHVTIRLRDGREVRAEILGRAPFDPDGQRLE